MIKYFSLILILTSLIRVYGQGEWKRGKYYDLESVPHEGLIKYNYDYSPYFKFKESNSSKEKKLKAWKTKGFVVETDTFTVLENFYLSNGMKLPVDFVEVIEVGNIILLKNYSSIYNSSVGLPGSPAVHFGSTSFTTYILTKPNTEKLWTVYTKRKKFEQQISFFAQEFPKSSKYSNVDSLTIELIPEFVSEYNMLKN